MFRRHSLALQVLGRIGLLLGVVLVSMLTSSPAHNLLINTFHYQYPPGFFGFSLNDWELALTMTMPVWGGIVFAGIGKKIDYIFILLIFTLSFIKFAGSSNVTLDMYGALVGAALIGIFLGYVLKVARLHWAK
jgi:hypothetical protein